MVKVRHRFIALSLVAVMLFSFFTGCTRADNNTPSNPTNPTNPTEPTEPNEPSEPEPNPNLASIFGLSDVEIMAGTYFDFYQGVSAKSKNGTDISHTLSIEGDIDLATAGTYSLTYTATDSAGTKKQTRKIYVTHNPLLDVSNAPFLYASDVPYNIARGTAVTASGSSPANITDGNHSTRWESAHNDGPFDVVIDLGAKLSFTQIVLDWETAYAKSYTISVSNDGRSYTTIHTQTDQTIPQSSPAHHIQTLDLAHTAQFIKLTLSKRSTNYGYSLFEVQVMGLEGISAPAGMYDDLYYAKSVLDEQWLVADLGAVKPITRVELSGVNWVTPSDLNIYHSENGTDYTYLGNRADLRNLSLSARYIKAELYSRPFRTNAYKISNFAVHDVSGAMYALASVEASSSFGDNTVAKIFDTTNTYDTYWESDREDIDYQLIDVGSVVEAGTIVLKWETNTGKVYDVFAGTDRNNLVHIFRQTHGALQTQYIDFYDTLRYIKVVDYSSNNQHHFNLLEATVTAQAPTRQKQAYNLNLELPMLTTHEIGEGSYISGLQEFPTARLVTYLAENLRNKPIPSNDWWQSLLINNLGHAMSMNPLRVKHTNAGIALSNPGEGYFAGEIYQDRTQRVDPNLDVFLGSTDIDTSKSFATVVGYSDYGITTTLSDNALSKFTFYLNQGATAVYAEVLNRQSTYVQAPNLVKILGAGSSEVLSADGETYIGDHITLVVEGVKSVKNNQTTYEDRYYVVNVANGTQFVRYGSTVFMSMAGNYVSVGAVALSQSKSVAQSVELAHRHGYAFPVSTVCNYNVNYQTNDVTTIYKVRTVLKDTSYESEPIVALLPHMYKQSANTMTDYFYKSVRGNMKVFVGKEYYTVDKFYGMVPQFVEPNNPEYSREKLLSLLTKIDEATSGNLMSGDPYWQGKNLQPMAMAVLASDQIGAIEYRDKFLQRIKIILTDWYTYDGYGEIYTGTYFYYDTEWGTLYYRHSEFGANSGITDHHFTYGYYTLASAVLATYDKQFYEDYKEIIRLLIRDYASYDRNDDMFCYFRNFDPFAGHSWAGGYADNDDGNNQEAGGESLHGWVGMYMWAMLENDQAMIDAAVYGFTTELRVVKNYWFNYDGDAYGGGYPYAGVGQIYGATNFYGTFFNGQPAYVYGIHWLPGSEFLTSYAIEQGEAEALERVYNGFVTENYEWLASEGIMLSSPDDYDWKHIIWPIQAIFDADAVIEKWDDNAISYNGTEMFNVYMLVHGLKSMGARTEIWAEGGKSATVYYNADTDTYSAMVFNPLEVEQECIFRNASGVIGSAVIPARGLCKVDPFTRTENIPVYLSQDSVSALETFSTQNAVIENDLLVSQNGSDYSALFYWQIAQSQRYIVEVYAMGEGEVTLHFGDQSETVSVSAGQVTRFDTEAIRIYGNYQLLVECGGNVRFSSVTYRLATATSVIGGATATANSVNGTNLASNAVDGNTTTRWESATGEGPFELIVNLGQVRKLQEVEIIWEAASATTYKLYVSEDGVSYTEVLSREDYSTPSGANNPDTLSFATVYAQYIKIECIKRTLPYGYSIFELDAFYYN